MINEYKVSIVIPVYNAEEYLRRCLDSIINQSYKNIEVIALNDGSNDSSWDILLEYKDKYPTLIFPVNQKNMGVSRTRNKGIKIASGDYLMLLDNDDYLDLDYVEKFVTIILESDADLVIGGYRRPDKSGKIVELVTLDQGAYSKYKIVAAWAKIYRLDYIKKNKIEFLVSNIGEDIHFTIQAVSLTNKLIITDYVGYNWFYNEDSVSNTAHKNMNNNLQFDLLLNKTFTAIENKVSLQDPYIEYYFIKLTIWFFMYASRGANYNIIKEKYDEYFGWLEKKFPKYKKNNLVKFSRPKGETLDKRIIVKLFMMMHKIHVDKVFLYIYSKL